MGQGFTMVSHGSFHKTFEFFDAVPKRLKKFDFSKYGDAGVAALQKYTPKDTGKTSESWFYEVERKNNQVDIVFYNTNVVDGWANVAILLQYGHGTKNGAYVQGVDYINPALKPIFDQIAMDLWTEVIR